MNEKVLTKIKNIIDSDEMSAERKVVKLRNSINATYENLDSHIINRRKLSNAKTHILNGDKNASRYEQFVNNVINTLSKYTADDINVNLHSTDEGKTIGITTNIRIPVTVSKNASIDELISKIENGADRILSNVKPGEKLSKIPEFCVNNLRSIADKLKEMKDGKVVSISQEIDLTINPYTRFTVGRDDTPIEYMNDSFNIRSTKQPLPKLLNTENEEYKQYYGDGKNMENFLWSLLSVYDVCSLDDIVDRIIPMAVSTNGDVNKAHIALERLAKKSFIEDKDNKYLKLITEKITEEKKKLEELLDSREELLNNEGKI